MGWDLLEESKKLIGLPSVTTEGNREVVEHLVPFCRGLGFSVTLQTGTNGRGGREVNLIAHTVREGAADLCPGGLLFVTHLDTVPPGSSSLWTETGGDPFRATVKGDRIYGLGSADTKLDFLCKLKAVEEVGLKNIKVPFSLVGTYGEERGLAGIKRIRDSGVLHPRWALVGEPSSLKPVLAHKGILYMKAMYGGSDVGAVREPPLRKTFRGRAAHGSTPHLGENAILKALDWILEERKGRKNLQLLSIVGGKVHNIVPEECVVEVGEGEEPSPQIDFLRGFLDLLGVVERDLKEKRDATFDPPVTTYNVGVIRGDRDRLELEFDLRLIPSIDGNHLFQIFKGLEKIPGGKVEVISSNPPMNTPAGCELARRVFEALEEEGISSKPEAKSGNTEGAILTQMGAEAVVIGPGLSTGNIHQPNEYNEISQLKKAVTFYTRFLRKFC